MISDTERREVARRLREYVDIPDDWWADTYSGFYVEKCVFGDVERHRESELFARLADLIEPMDSGSAEGAGSGVSKCDRDALLALADEMEGHGIDLYDMIPTPGSGCASSFASWTRSSTDEVLQHFFWG